MAELYAIVGSMERARFMLEQQVPYLQLRFKEGPLEPHRAEIAGWPRRYRRTRLIVNDDPAFAESVGAWGAHLGQEDLERHPPERLRGLRLKLGISTHSDAEIARALTYSPALLGFGPIFATSTKDVKHPPTGVARLREVVARVPLPIVAIGGIGAANLDAVVATGVALVAMISYLDAITSRAQMEALLARLRATPAAAPATGPFVPRA
ncbi:MAG: thiamine phosphate synthase [Candidatus Lambdaproteobacteria bacterium]|nr:thiamine phosphate synthase [Candidatus Lambdaproteobacteria bacterium]